MKLESIDINELVPYENNPRKNDEAVANVKNSIKEFGFVVPIIIDKDNVVVAGHTRLKALKELGYKKVDCVRVADLTDEQVKALRLADNKVAEKAEWDVGLLDIELGNILDFDMSQFGFDIDKLNEDYGTDFELPDGDHGELEQITFTLHHEQAELIRYAIEQIIDNDEIVETFGNTNKNGNAIYEVVRQWAEQKK